MISVQQLMKTKKTKPSVISKKDKDSISKALTLHSSMIYTKNYHKFVIINGASLKKDQVLAAVIKHCSPHCILPVKYVTNEENEGHSSFLSSNCWCAIKSICLSDLTITIPETGQQLEVVIYLDYFLGDDERCPTKVPGDVARMAMRIKKNYGHYRSDCSNFEFNPDLGDFYFPLWAPQYQRIFADVVKTVVNMTHLNLSHNNIVSLVGFAKLTSPNLEEIDLSYNKIDWPELIPLHAHKLRGLWLDGNPLCSVSLADYITRVKVLFPTLHRLDGELIYSERDLGFIAKNYFVNISPHQLVDNFLHHYFKWFLMPDGRNSMIHMYHNKATLSVSSYLRSANENITINFFNDLSRNILKITNYAKACDSFKGDRSLIVFHLTAFPYVEIDQMSTTVDVPYFVENKVIQISMSGIFRDRSHSMYWMNFTFMLQAINESNIKEWKIINQLISIMPASPEQCKCAFVKEVKPIDTSAFELSKDEILLQFKELTSLKTSWCKQFLESTRWNLESALQSFVDQFKGDLVEETAFLPA